MAEMATTRWGGGSTSSGLIERAKAREPEAWRRLVQLYGPLVYLCCRRYGVERHDAADVVQETFSAVSGHLEQFRRDRPADSFRAWLWTIARNKIRDHQRRAQQGPQAIGGTDAQQQMASLPGDPTAADEPPVHVDGLLARRALDLVRSEFEDRTWQAFYQTTVAGRPAADVSVELGMSKPAVRQSKYRVLRRLRQELEGLLD